MPKRSTISIISHTIKILLRIILNRLIPQAEYILEEEQAGFRKNRSTNEHILNCRLIMENTSINKVKFIIISLITRKPLIEYGMMVYGT